MRGLRRLKLLVPDRFRRHTAVVACHVYGHPKWETFQEMFDMFERIETTGAVRFVSGFMLMGLLPWLLNLLEWRL